VQEAEAALDKPTPVMHRATARRQFHYLWDADKAELVPTGSDSLRRGTGGGGEGGCGGGGAREGGGAVKGGEGEGVCWQGFRQEEVQGAITAALGSEDTRELHEAATVLREVCAAGDEEARVAYPAARGKGPPQAAQAGGPLPGRGRRALLRQPPGPRRSPVSGLHILFPSLCINEEQERGSGGGAEGGREGTTPSLPPWCRGLQADQRCSRWYGPLSLLYTQFVLFHCLHCSFFCAGACWRTRGCWCTWRSC